MNNYIVSNGTYTNIFNQSLSILKLRTKVLRIYTILKLFAISVIFLYQIVFLRCQVKYPTIWAMTFFVLQLSNFKLLCYQLQVLADPNKIHYIADKLQQNNQPQQQNITLSEREKLILNIKVQMSAVDLRVQKQLQVSSIISQLLVLNFLYIMSHDGVHVSLKQLPLPFYQNCENSLLNTEFYMFLLLIIEYINYYVFIIAIIFYFLYVIVYFSTTKLRNQIKRLKRIRKINNFPIITLQNLEDDRIKGSKECSICMQEYETGQQILQLPCNQLHHFHDICIRQWLNQAFDCPLCRQQV